MHRIDNMSGVYKGHIHIGICICIYIQKMNQVQDENIKCYQVWYMSLLTSIV